MCVDEEVELDFFVRLFSITNSIVELVLESDYLKNILIRDLEAEDGVATKDSRV
jgi:hypothetical protein